jgi:hypothetical protein
MKENHVLKKRVGIWIRVSTEDQAKGESPQHHEARAREYAKFNEWAVVEVYDLAGVSGKTVMENTEAKRMISDVKRGHITGLIFSKLAEFASKVQERFAKGDPKTKKEILTTIGSNLILKDKKLLIEARKPFFILENTLSPEMPIIWPIEPEKTKAAYGQITPTLFLRPLVRGERDDVRTYLHKAERAAALIYAHFKKEFGVPDKR